ncbi:hypothetical protein [Baekduia sp. Peel2402]|uniref:hypothetical protein n=1 Tax=Baekduia sp. Peel2402 TaxID=3458296 RepID=UPI00403E6D27
MPSRFRQLSSDHGQASLEWLAVVTLVCGLLALGAGLAQADAVGRRVTRQMARALCLVRDGDCRRDQEPCLLDSDELSRHTEVGVFFVRLKNNHYSLIEHRSDGTYAVTIDDGNALGLTAQIGLEAGVRALGVDVSAGGEIAASYLARLPHARTWFVRSEDEARAVIETGGAWRPPDRTSDGFDSLAQIGASVGADALRHLEAGSVELSFDTRVGTVTDHRTGRHRIYVTADDTQGAKALVLGSTETREASEVYAVETSPTGRPLALTITSIGAFSASRDLPAVVQPVVGRLASTGADRYEVTAALDLTEPAALVAASELLDAIAHKHARARPSAALRRLIETSGTIEARIFSATDEDESSFAGNATVGPASLGLDHLEQRHDEVLLAAASRGLDGKWISREDCIR